MSSSSAHPSVLTTARTSSSACGMSSSLRERLKKCGRYRPGASSERPTDTEVLPATSGLNSPHSRMTKDISIDNQRRETGCITKLHREMCSNVEPDSDSPKRRKLGTINKSPMQINSDIIKRRKLECSDEYLDKNNSDGYQVELELQSQLCLQTLFRDNSTLAVLKKSENLTNENGLSSTAITQCENGLSCSTIPQCENGSASLAITQGENSLSPSAINLFDESHVNDPYSNVTESNLLPGNISQYQNLSLLKDLKAQFEKDLKVKDEQLRKLKMVKMYREKNNLTELQRLIDIWCDVSQRALVDLHNLQPSPRPSMTELVNHLQIDHELIHYVADEEAFS